MKNLEEKIKANKEMSDFLDLLLDKFADGNPELALIKLHKQVNNKHQKILNYMGNIENIKDEEKRGRLQEFLSGIDKLYDEFIKAEIKENEE